MGPCELGEQGRLPDGGEADEAHPGVAGFAHVETSAPSSAASPAPGVRVEELPAINCENKDDTRGWRRRSHMRGHPVDAKHHVSDHVDDR